MIRQQVVPVCTGEAKVWFFLFPILAVVFPSLLSSSQLKIVVWEEKQYENDLDDFNGNGYNRFSMISS